VVSPALTLLFNEVITSVIPEVVDVVDVEVVVLLVVVVFVVVVVDVDEDEEEEEFGSNIDESTSVMFESFAARARAKTRANPMIWYRCTDAIAIAFN